jgi:hypothetical protein
LNPANFCKLVAAAHSEAASKHYGDSDDFSPRAPVGRDCGERTGTLASDYLGSYSGPILYTNGFLPSVDAAPTKFGYTAIAEQADGIGAITDAGGCGVQLLATIEVPAMEVRGPGSSSCKFALPSGNLAASGSAVTVGGHNAYLPSSVHTFLIGTQGLALTQPLLTTVFSAASNGDVTITESAQLTRCSVSDAYPPTAVSCPSLVPTGVTFQRVTNIFRGAHQVRVRDTFSSTDAAAHAITLEYQSQTQPAATGKVGYTFPTHGSTFSASSPDQVVTGLGSKAGSMLVRSDLYADSGDPLADTLALTWSRPPSKIVFGHTSANAFAMPYTLSIPANGKAFLGFADSQSITTVGATSLAGTAATDMVNPPTVTSPLAGGTVATQSTTIKGSLTAAANGLPTSVTINGHPATITETSATTATYASTFGEAWGTHTLTVTAPDAVGNTATKSINVVNKAALVFTTAAHLTGSKLTIPLACKSYAATTCTGKLVIKTSGGTTIGTTNAFSIAKGTTKTIAITLHPVNHTPRVYLYQREPNGTYPLASSKPFKV